MFHSEQLTGAWKFDMLKKYTLIDRFNLTKFFFSSATLKVSKEIKELAAPLDTTKIIKNDVLVFFLGIV